MRGPWHIWVVGILALLWNSGGAYDYVMTQLENEAYLSMLTEAQRAYVDAFPTWFVAVWALAIWSAVLGSLLILMRSRVAGPVFALSILSFLASTYYALAVASPSALEVTGTTGLIFSGAIFLSLVLLFLYSRAMTRRGYLS